MKAGAPELRISNDYFSYFVANYSGHVTCVAPGRRLVSRWTEQGRLIFVFLMTLIAPDMGITNGHQSKTQIVGKVILKSFKYKMSQTIPAFRFGLVFREHI